MRAVADRSKKQSKKEEDVAGFKRETYDILGDYIFTEGEMRQLADSLANKNIEIQGLEDEKKATMSGFKARIDKVQAEVNLLASHLSQGKKQQFYKCYLDFYRSRKMRLWKDANSDKVIKEEPMQEEDYQLEFGNVKK